jgi:hypothetical protein
MKKQHAQKSTDKNATHELVERLRAGEKSDPRSAESRMAAQLHAMTTDDSLDDALDHKMEHAIVQRFGNNEESTNHTHNFANTQKKRSIFSKLSLAFAPAMAIALAVVAFVVTQDGTTTLADAQGFESLSRAEEILGQLPEDADVGIDVAQLRKDINEINVARAATDTTLDPEADLFPHVELRNSALSLVEKESNIVDTLESASLNVASLDTSITTLEGKAQKWPTQNEGVSFDVHAKAVNAFETHEQEWNQMIAELIEEYLTNQ